MTYVLVGLAGWVGLNAICLAGLWLYATAFPDDADEDHYGCRFTRRLTPCTASGGDLVHHAKGRVSEGFERVSHAGS